MKELNRKISNWISHAIFVHWGPCAAALSYVQHYYCVCTVLFESVPVRRSLHLCLDSGVDLPPLQYTTDTQFHAQSISNHGVYSGRRCLCHCNLCTRAECDILSPDSCSTPPWWRLQRREWCVSSIDISTLHMALDRYMCSYSTNVNITCGICITLKWLRGVMKGMYVCKRLCS